jgi:hypothetical protein
MFHSQFLSFLLIVFVKGEGPAVIELETKLGERLIKIAEAACIEELTKVHTLRHTFASHLVMQGVDLPIVKRLMGLSDIQTTIYAHLTPDHKADALNKLSFAEQIRHIRVAAADPATYRRHRRRWKNPEESWALLQERRSVADIVVIPLDQVKGVFE